MSGKSEAKDRIAALRKQIGRHDRLYFVENQPEISDAEYDKLFAELEKLENKYPDLVTPGSPTQRVGAEPVKDLKKVAHVAPMLSLDAVRDKNEVADFLQRTRDDATDEIERRGGRVTSSVSGKTDYVVVGDDPGSKLDDAQAEGVDTLGEDAFKDLLDKGGQGHAGS